MNNRVIISTGIGVGLILLITIGIIIYLVHPRHHQKVTPGGQPEIVPSGPSAITQDSCPRPSLYETNYDYDYTKYPHEYRNANSSTDYFHLSISWSPSYCHGNPHAAKIFQCQHSFGFVVHGLWPSSMNKSIKEHPRNCRNEGPMSLDIIKKYFCIMPSEKLMQTEWEKHGTCYWKTPEDYFKQIEYLYSKIHLPTNLNEILNNTTTTKKFRYSSVKQSFLDANPQLKSDGILIQMTHKNTKLRAVAFCYDLNFKYANCG